MPGPAAGRGGRGRRWPSARVGCGHFFPSPPELPLPELPEVEELADDVPEVAVPAPLELPPSPELEAVELCEPESPDPAVPVPEERPPAEESERESLR